MVCWVDLLLLLPSIWSVHSSSSTLSYRELSLHPSTKLESQKQLVCFHGLKDEMMKLKFCFVLAFNLLITVFSSIFMRELSVQICSKSSNLHLSNMNVSCMSLLVAEKLVKYNHF